MPSGEREFKYLRVWEYEGMDCKGAVYGLYQFGKGVYLSQPIGNRLMLLQALVIVDSIMA